MDIREFLAASSSKYVKDYFEAVGHFNKREWPQTVAAAKYNLTDETLPRALQIKNCILIAVATDDWNEADEARKLAEKVWEEAKARIRTDPEHEYEREALGRLREALDTLDVGEEEDSGIEDEDVDMEEEEFEEFEEEEEEEEEEQLERDVLVKGGIKSGIEGGIEGKLEAADEALVPVKVESDMDMKQEADVKQEYEAGGSGGSSSHLENMKGATLPIRSVIKTEDDDNDDGSKAWEKQWEADEAMD